jgi:hypothetical protein
MSEYWKSIPKYWCKYCKDYVKDTKLERQQHEATPRHQGQIQRSLRTLHREKEAEERQKERAKAEVARLNGVVNGKSSAPSASAAPAGFAKKEAPRQATAEERKRQIQQLADMGVAVPEEFRREMAMAGDWERVSVAPVATEDFSKKPDGLAFGVRKRKLEEEAEEEAAELAAAAKQRQWGSRFKTYPGKKSKGDEEDDVEALLGGIVTKSEVKEEELEVKNEEGETLAPVVKEDPPPIKKEESTEEQGPMDKLATGAPDVPVKPEEHPQAEEKLPGAGIVFKKRKPKVIRQT